MKYLITGAKGQLGREFSKTLESLGCDFLALDKDAFDIADFPKVMTTLKHFMPDVVINCAAYNQVDKAEVEFDQALRSNCIGVSNLAIACRELKAFLIHYSTDYVFDGKKVGLYNEEDRANPLNKYALSKYLGERQIETLLRDYLVFRTSWVYGEGSQNFLYKLSLWSQTQEYLKVACDEFSVPTSTRTIVEITLKAIKKGLAGLYHLVNSDYCSRYEWAREFLKLKGINKFIYPVSQAEFNLPAKRPSFSAMSNEKLSKILNISIDTWKDELKRFMRNKI
ncbi:MAG: dTDP-4-dehydrorhamnose reductase [Thermodesulfovibrionales bacterium]|nr:dTDP-4-dehydrorhamnose reductase [Thermodesulfovibrionales bacterium]